jgi:hypothetical protein
VLLVIVKIGPLFGSKCYLCSLFFHYHSHSINLLLPHALMHALNTLFGSNYYLCLLFLHYHSCSLRIPGANGIVVRLMNIPSSRCQPFGTNQPSSGEAIMSIFIYCLRYSLSLVSKMLCRACPELVLCYHEVCLAAPNSKPLGSMDRTPETILIVGEMKVYGWDNENV